MLPEEQNHASQDRGELDLSFSSAQAELAILLALDRIEERQEMHSKLLFKILEKVAPDVDAKQFDAFPQEEAFRAGLLRVQDDINTIKAILSHSTTSAS